MVVRIGRSGDRPSEAASAWNPSAIWCPCLASPTWRQTSVTWCPNPTWSPGYPRNRWSPFPPLWHDQWTQRQIPLPTTQSTHVASHAPAQARAQLHPGLLSCLLWLIMDQQLHRLDMLVLLTLLIQAAAAEEAAL